LTKSVCIVKEGDCLVIKKRGYEEPEGNLYFYYIIIMIYSIILIIVPLKLLEINSSLIHTTTYREANNITNYLNEYIRRQINDV
jgi:hypothetical protein